MIVLMLIKRIELEFVIVPEVCLRLLRNQTALSRYFWNLKDQGLTPQIKWQIVRQFSTANNFNGRCNMCIDEKISIINFKDHRLLLNERNKLVFKCRHKSKFKLS